MVTDRFFDPRSLYGPEARVTGFEGHVMTGTQSARARGSEDMLIDLMERRRDPRP